MKIYTISEKELEEFLRRIGGWRTLQSDLDNMKDAFHDYCLKFGKVVEE